MNIKQIIKTICICISALGFFVPSSSSALIILDQDYIDYAIAGSSTVANDRTQYQTVTTGVTGILANIDVSVMKRPDAFEDLLLGVWSTNVSGLLESQLASFSISAENISTDIVNFDVLSANLLFSAGDIFAISLNSDAINVGTSFSERYEWRYPSNAPDYEGGQAFTCIPDISNCFAQFGKDYLFRTYVQTVPIPATIWLIGLGIGLISVARRKKS
ncbi:MAG: PEP-CTERM sorting domain-containing protein [Gammaproteobacteria bacterium]|nr:PEP-CTERM sorting domain-containing protein [Gammaproteobacteria bacterium]